MIPCPTSRPECKQLQYKSDRVYSSLRLVAIIAVVITGGEIIEHEWRRHPGWGHRGAQWQGPKNELWFWITEGNAWKIYFAPWIDVGNTDPFNRVKVLIEQYPRALGLKMKNNDRSTPHLVSVQWEHASTRQKSMFCFYQRKQKRLLPLLVQWHWMKFDGQSLMLENLLRKSRQSVIPVWRPFLLSVSLVFEINVCDKKVLSMGP